MRRYIAAAVLWVVVALGCRDVGDPLPCSTGGDAPTCACSAALEAGEAQGFVVSVPDVGFDAMRVRVIGPVVRVISVALVGGSWTGSLGGLPLGEYTLAAEGLVAGQTDHFGVRDGLQIRECDGIATATIPLTSFRPSVPRLTLDGSTIAVEWDAVPQAESYVVETDSTHAFSTATQYIAEDTDYTLPAVAGRHLVRIRAGHPLVPAGRASEAAVVVVAPPAPLSTEALMAHVAFLANDSMYGRGAGCVHERLAADYVRGWMRTTGLSAGAPDFFQEFTATSGSPWWRCLPGRSQNVLGVLPGEGALADEWVVVGAHYDHVGWRLEGPDSTLVIYNGADDNASGTSALIETARQLADWVQDGTITGSRRSLLVLAFGAEEVGLLGSMHFVANPTVPLTQMAAMVNLDMVGRLRDDLLTVATDTVNAWWEGLVAGVNDDALALSFDNFAGSDDVPFAAVGIPTVFFFTDFHPDYHRPTDDTERINADGLRSVASLAARLVRTLVTQEVLAGGSLPIDVTR